MASQRSLFSFFKPEVVNSEAIVRPIVDQIVEGIVKSEQNMMGQKLHQKHYWVGQIYTPG